MRISPQRSLLNFKSFSRIRVIACPYLRNVTQHSQIKPVTARRATFDKQIGKQGRYSFKNIVEGDNIIVKQSARIYKFVYSPVAIPFQIFGVTSFYDGRNTVYHVISRLFVRDIKQYLVSYLYRFSAAVDHGVFGMNLKQLAFNAYHFRLHPYPESETFFSYRRRNLFQRSPEFVLILNPIAERRRIVVSFSEPPVVQHK